MIEFNADLGARLVEGLALVTGVVGAILNAQGRKASFYVWTAANFLMLLLMLRAGLYLAATLYVVYLAINVYGIHRWSKRSPLEGPTPQLDVSGLTVRQTGSAHHTTQDDSGMEDKVVILARGRRTAAPGYAEATAK